jgi:dihydroflavonol-4-reductase
MARALVLGATGHLGAHIVRALLAEGHTVRAAHRSDRCLHVLDGLTVERARVDLDSLDGLSAALKSCEWVFHAAGYYPRAAVRRQTAVNHAIATTRRALDAIRRAGPARVVFTSSAATVHRMTDRLATEQDVETWPPTEWKPLYATVKIAMEQEALRAARDGLPVIIVNPSVCIGEYDAHQFSGRAVLVFARSRLPFYLEHTMNVVYTGDVGVGHLRAAQRGRLGERYLLAGRNLSIREFGAIVARTTGTRPPRWRLSNRVVFTAALTSELMAWLTRREPVLPRSGVQAMLRQGPGLDATKARTELGLPQTPVEDAVARAVVWFRSRGDLR